MKMKSLGKKRLNVPIAEGTPITMGEMVLFWELMVYNGYKNYNDVVKLGQEFILQYPTSMYFASIENMISQALTAIDNQNNSKGRVEKTLPLYINQMHIGEIYSLRSHNSSYGGEWPKNKDLYNIIKSNIEERIVPILGKDWSLYFNTQFIICYFIFI